MLRFVSVAAALIAGCGEGPAVAILFPNPASRDATMILEVELHDPRTTGSVSCANFAEVLADEDEVGLGSETAGVPLIPPFEDVIPNAPRRPQSMYVRAYAEGPDRPPFLAGCADDFDPDASTGDDTVEIHLEHIRYRSLSIRDAGGNRQVGRPGERLPDPLRVRAEAAPKGRLIGMPGLPILFATEPPFMLEETEDRFAGIDGIIETHVLLPDQSASGAVRAKSKLLDNNEVNFTVTARSELAIRTRSVELDFAATPSALAAGAITGGGLDLIAVGSSGGTAAAMVAHDPLGAAPSILPIEGDLGTSAIAVTVTGDRLAIAAARGAARENAEVRLVRLIAGSLEVEHTYVLTSSNAVGLTSYQSSPDAPDSLAVATSGRTADTVACAPNTCTCGPGEYCGSEGVCIAHDGVVSLLLPDGAGGFTERNGCSDPSCEQGACCPGLVGSAASKTTVPAGSLAPCDSVP